MLRLNALAAMFLSVLVSCGPSTSEVPVSATPPARTSSELVDPIQTVTFTWKGGTAYCTNCTDRPGTDYGDLCSTDSGWAEGKKTFADPVPSGYAVVAASAQVSGGCIGAPDTSSQVTVKLNTQDIGKYTLTKVNACRDLVCNRYDVPVTAAYPNDFPGYQYGKDNTFQLVVPSGVSHCVSHAYLKLTVEQRQLTVSPSSLDFGRWKSGSTSVEKEVTVTAGPKASVTINALELVTGTVFSVRTETGESLPLTLNAGTSRKLLVKFSPKAVSATQVQEQLKIKSNAFTAEVPVNLFGYGVQYANDVRTESGTNVLDFGEQLVGTASLAKIVTVHNAGPTNLWVQDLVITAPFEFVLPLPQGKTFTVAPGATSDPIQVVFRPSTPGPITSGSLTIKTDASDLPNGVVTLTGDGVSPVFSVSDTDLNFNQQVVGVTPSPSQTVYVSNTGSGTLKVNYPSTITNSSGKTVFTISPSGPKNIKSTDAPLAITVTYIPERSSEDTFLTFTNDNSVVLGRVRLRGQGVSKLQMDTIGTHDFGTLSTGATSTKKTIKLTNKSSVPIVLTSVYVAPPFYASAPSQTTLSTKDSFATVDVQFKPIAGGVFEETLSVVSDADVFTDALKFRGTGLFAHGEFKRATDPDTAPYIKSLPFDGVREKETKTIVVRLYNTGNTPLTFKSQPVATPSAYAYVSSVPYDQVSINPNGYHEFRVTFTPDARADYPGKLTISSNSDTALELPLTGFGSYSELKVLPTVADFGDVQVGTQSTPTTVTISNAGNAPVNLLSLSVTAPFAIIYHKRADAPTLDDKPPREISVTNPFKFDVVFKPGEKGDVTGNVTIGTDFGDNMTVALQGSGTVPQLQVQEPFDLNFGNQRLKVPSKTLPLTIKNAGKAPLKISSVVTRATFSIVPGSRSDFPLTLGPGAQESLNVTFTPTAEGEETGEVFFVSDTAEAINHIPTLTGVGVDGKLKVTPSVVNFGSVDVNSAGASLQSVKLENIGQYALTIKEVTAPGGDFRVFGLDPNLVLPANGGSWTFTASFAPKSQGYVTASAIIKTDAVTNPNINLAMDGTGVSAAVELQPPDFISFGKVNVGADFSANLTIKNTGQRVMTVSSIGFADVTAGTEMAADFSHTVTAAFDVPANGGSVTVPLKFKPSQVGARKALAIIRSNASNDPAAEVELVGEGTSPQLKLEPSTLEFGKLLVGNSLNKSFRIKNTGNGPFKLTGIALGGLNKDRFTMTEIGLPLTLNPGGPTGTSPDSFVDVTVTFQPDAVKDFIGTVVVTSDADVKSATVVLTGSGINDEIEVTNSLFFGQHLVGNRSSLKPVVITNNSAGAIVISDLSVDESRFSITKPELPLTIAAKTSREIGVDFTPLVEGEVKGRMKITFRTPAQQRDVELQGKGIAKVLSINSLANQDFGALRVGTNKTGTPVVLTNVSSEIITLAEPQEEYRLGESFTYDKTLVANKQLKPGESVSMPVSYAPKEEVPSEVKLLFGTTTPLQSATVNAVLSGRATKSLIQVDKSLVDFDWVDVGETVSSGEITVVNKSAQQQRVTLTMKNGAPYSLEKPALDNPLPPEGSATFKVIFTPDSPDAFDDEVWVSIQTGEPETTIKVRGNGRDIMAGGGGCSCGSTEAGSAGMLMLLALVGLGSRRRRRE